MSDIIKFILLILLLIGIFIGGYYFGNKNHYPEIVRETNTRVDTLTQTEVIHHKPVQITKEGSVKIIRDTIIQIKPFEASIDTVYLRDTIKVAYSYPLNRFDIDIKRMPDSVHTKILVITKYNEIKEDWWIKPAYAGAGLVAGFILGKF